MLDAGRRQKSERRRLPRIPVAIPVRYATEEGDVGVGALIDVHEQGAGLLVPEVAADAMHVWLQFLWFNDRIGLQGRIAFVRETPDGFHLGLQLHMLHPESVDFLTNLLIPLGLQKFRLDRRRAFTFLDSLLMGRNRPWNWRERRRYLPVLIEQGHLKVWAITEDRHEHGAVLLLPQLPKADDPLKMTTLGSAASNEARVAQSEILKFAPVDLYRVVVLYASEPAREQAVPLLHSEAR
ncbi:MAG: PilZ domain-containing protein [Armatimonadota bacterium]